MIKRITVAICLLATFAEAEDKKPEPPKIVAVAPLRLVIGETQKIQLRGLKLKGVTEVRCTPPMVLSVKEKKDAAPPNGLTANDVGDQELVVELTVPADCTAKTVSLEVVTLDGTTIPREFAIVAKDAEAREKEPNNGFREAQPWDTGKPMTGRIDAEKDVDVFRVEGHADKTFAVTVSAAAAGSLALDPILSVFDADGRLLSSADDSPGIGTNAQITIVPKRDGPLFIVVSDANDRGGEWHEYRLKAQP